MDAALSRPRFRTDLVAQPIEESGQRFIDVTDPDSGTTFRFYEVEYSIACAMDGQRNVSALADWAEAELGIAPKPSSDELERVIHTLSELGYLATQSSLAADIGLGHAGAQDVKSVFDQLPATPDLELGFAGNENSDQRGEMPQAADIGLGHAGNEAMAAVADGVAEIDEDEPTAMLERPATGGALDLPPPPPPGGDVEPMAVLRPTSNADSDEDGPTGLPAPVSEFEDEVSVDLTDHLKLGPDALKEAVRQSKMIPSVDPPSLSSGDAGDSSALGPPRPPKPVPPIPPPTELPDKPAISVSKTGDAAPQEEKKSRLGLLLGILLLLIIGAAAADYFTGFIGLRDMLGLGDEQPAKPVVKPEPVVKQPPPPEPPTATLSAVEVPAQQVTAPADGVIAFVAEAGAEVEEDAEVAKLKGYEQIESKIEQTRAREEVYQKRLEKAQAAGNEGDVAKNQTKVDEKKQAIAELETELAAFILKAPVAGVIDSPVAANSRVKAEDVILGIKIAPTLQATFTMPDGLTYDEGADVEVSAGDKTLACMVMKVEDANVTVDCSSDGDIAADTDVTLPLPAKK